MPYIDDVMSYNSLTTICILQFVQIALCRQNLESLESEFMYWFNNHMVTFEHQGNKYTMARYNCKSDGPRPESYFEDFEVPINNTFSGGGGGGEGGGQRQTKSW